MKVVCRCECCSIIISETEFGEESYPNGPCNQPEEREGSSTYYLSALCSDCSEELYGGRERTFLTPNPYH